MTISLGKQALRLPEPLSVDHKLLRVQQGREVIVGLRSEAVRIAEPSTARPGETLITGLVEHVEFQGHEALVHFNTGSRPAVVPELEAPRPASRPSRRRRRDGSVLDRLRERAGSLRAGPVVVLDEPPSRTRPRRPPTSGSPATWWCAPHPTWTCGTACRCRCWSTSPTCSSSTSTASASAPPPRGSPIWKSDPDACPSAPRSPLVPEN